MTYDHLEKMLVAQLRSSYQPYPHMMLLATPCGIEMYIAGIRALLVEPDNGATYFLTCSDRTANNLLYSHGLGEINSHRGPCARYLFNFRGKEYRYRQGLHVNLASGEVDAPQLGQLTVDAHARYALLKLIRSKASQAQSYLRLTGMTMKAIDQNDDAPTTFINAVLLDRTRLIATIPCQDCNYYLHMGKELYAKYPEILEEYIGENRAALYQAGGVISVKEPT